MMFVVAKHLCSDCGMSNRVRLMKNHKGNDCCYSGLERLPDGMLVATTYGHWTEGEQPYIVSVRMKIEELDGTKVPSGLKPAPGVSTFPTNSVLT